MLSRRQQVRQKILRISIYPIEKSRREWGRYAPPLFPVLDQLRGDAEQLSEDGDAHAEPVARASNIRGLIA